MNRRSFIKMIAAAHATLMGGCAFVQKIVCMDCEPEKKKKVTWHKPVKTMAEHARRKDGDAKLVEKSRHFENSFADDVFVGPDREAIMYSVTEKLHRIQSFVGYGNFNILSWDQMLLYTWRYGRLKPFTRQEIRFLEELFYFDAKKYGFMGNKVFTSVNAAIRVQDARKIPNSGHYLLEGKPANMYSRIKRDVGEKLILTSGARGVVKQFYLFLAKAKETKGNLSMASRSLAPPGYSYHGRGDFDVGRTDIGERNFTEDFALTDEYKKLRDLGYVNIRYPESNKLGVRFEPWHIKVT